MSAGPPFCAGSLPRADTHADSLGCSTTSTHSMMISAGTTTSNTPGGSASSAQAPPIDPANDAMPSRTNLPRWPASSSRYPKTLLTLPGTSPVLFDTFAMTGGKPNASSVGKVISDPDPTTALIAPAPIAAARIARISPPLTSTIPGSARGRRVGRPACPPALDDQRHAEASRQVPVGEHRVHLAGGEHHAPAHEHGVTESGRHFLNVVGDQCQHRRR